MVKPKFIAMFGVLRDTSSLGLQPMYKQYTYIVSMTIIDLIILIIIKSMMTMVYM